MHINSDMQPIMDDQDFVVLRGLMEEEFGLSLRTQTQETFLRKIQPRLQALNMTTIKEYLQYLTLDPFSAIELHDLPSYVMNTESYFLREYAQFELFLELFNQKKKFKALTGNRLISILSAGCSEGQEPCSIAMLLRNQSQPLHGWNIRIFGYDINMLALTRARYGLYSAYSLRGPNTHLIKDYFINSGSINPASPKERLRLKPEITDDIEYIHGNILHSLSAKGLVNLDFIFCRNLLMYMSDKAVDRIALNLWEALSDDGYLFIGQSESLRNRDDLFEPLGFPGVTVYKKVRQAEAS